MIKKPDNVRLFCSFFMAKYTKICHNTLEGSDDMISIEELIAYMEQTAERPMAVEEIAEVFQLETTEEFMVLKQLLATAEAQGDLVFTRKKRYGSPSQLGLHIGKVQKHVKGFGFLRIENSTEEDIFIPQGDLNGALHNDKVLVRIKKPAMDDSTGNHYRAEGEVLRILKRNSDKVVGTLERHRGYGYVIPDDKRFPTDIFIPSEGFSNAKTGDKVLVELTQWPYKKRNAEGKVLKIIGKKGETGVDVLSILYKYDLPVQFPDAVEEMARQIDDQVSIKQMQNRIDLRDKILITIDGEDAKDLDDAVSLELSENGTWRLGVHIADVAQYVTEGDILDQEAFLRGTSVYLVDRVIPMLPKKLSNGICSLNAHEDRLALSCVMDIDYTGEVISADIFESVINVRHRMTYTNVNKILEGDESVIGQYQDIVPLIQQMATLQTILYQKRIQRGALDFEFPETKVKLDAAGKPIDIILIHRKKAERIIEEFMLAANETVAQRYYWLEIPFLYRIHEEPKTENVNDVNQFLQVFGYNIKHSNEKIHSKAYQKVLKKIKGKSEEQMISNVLLRSMNHAKYTKECGVHFGLASEYYTHFTSPIRRYPDLIVHRMIKEYMHNNGVFSDERKNYLYDQMAIYADQSSLREKIAEAAERESVDLKMVEYMEPFVGEEFNATISGVTAFGFFVQLENGVEGLVHISTLVDDFYRFVPMHYALLGENTAKKYQLGQKVKVRLVKVNTEEKQIDFEILNEKTPIIKKEKNFHTLTKRQQKTRK